MGLLGADPEIRRTAGGQKVAQLMIGTRRHWKNAAGEKEAKTQWHRVVAWNAPRGPLFADILQYHARKKDLIYVKGRVEYRSYRDQQQVERFVCEVVASEVIVIGRATRENGKPDDADIGDVPPELLAVPSVQ